MAISTYKTFSPGEILTAADLNASLAHITSNGEDLGWPATKAKDLDGFPLILDSDGDSQLYVTADDVAAIRLQSLDAFVFDGDVASPVNGLTFTSAATGTTPKVGAHGSDSNINLGLEAKGTGDIRLIAGGSETDIQVVPDGSESNISLRLLAKGSAFVRIGDGLLAFPDADGTANQTILTDGSGALSFGGAVPIVGDRVTFQQTTPSALFTKDTGVQSNCAFRLTTGTATSSLSGNTFTVNFASRASGNQSASHTHGVSGTTSGPTGITDIVNGSVGAGTGFANNVHTHTWSDTSGNQSANHTHTTDMSVDYYDLVIGEVT